MYTGSVKHSLCCTRKGHSKSGRTSKLHHWFKRYVNFAERVDLAMGGVASARPGDVDEGFSQPGIIKHLV